MMKVYQPALSESLDSIPEEYKIVFHGFAHVGNCDSYYLITHHGIDYCGKEKAGFLKSRYVPRFFDLDPASRTSKSRRDQDRHTSVSPSMASKDSLCGSRTSYLHFAACLPSRRPCNLPRSSAPEEVDAEQLIVKSSVC